MFYVPDLPWIFHIESDGSKEYSCFLYTIALTGPGVRGQGLEARGQRPVFGCQGTEARGWRPEVGGKGLEARGQRPGVRGKRLEVEGQRLESKRSEARGW